MYYGQFPSISWGMLHETWHLFLQTKKNPLPYIQLFSSQHNHSSEESAVQQVRDGGAWAAVVIGENFTADLLKRLGPSVNSSVIEGSTIYLYMDITSEWQ